MYPKTLTDESYPHHDASKHFTIERIISKMKTLRKKYKIALDSGHRSGGVRSLLNFTICAQICGEDV